MDERLMEKIERCLEGIHRLEVLHTRMAGDVEKNTEDLEEHIKRTNILEGKVQKMVYLLAVGAGIGVALYGPDFLKIIKVIP